MLTSTRSHQQTAAERKPQMVPEHVELEINPLSTQNTRLLNEQLSTLANSIPAIAKHLNERDINTSETKIEKTKELIHAINHFISNLPDSEQDTIIRKFNAIFENSNDDPNDEDFQQIREAFTNQLKDHHFSLTPEPPATLLHRILTIAAFLAPSIKFLAYTWDVSAPLLTRITSGLITAASGLAFSTLSINAIAELPTSFSFIRNASPSEICQGIFGILLLLAAATSDGVRTGYEASLTLGKPFAALGALEFISVGILGYAGLLSAKKLVRSIKAAPSLLQKLARSAPLIITIPSGIFFAGGAEQWTNNLPWYQPNCVVDHVIKMAAMSAHIVTQTACEAEGMLDKATQAISLSKSCKNKQPGGSITKRCTDICGLTKNFLIGFFVFLVGILAIYGVGNYQYTLGEDAKNFEPALGKNDTYYATCKRWAAFDGLANQIFLFSNIFMVLLALDNALSGMRKVAGAFSYSPCCRQHSSASDQVLASRAIEARQQSQRESAESVQTTYL
ncbi:hypothetical protein [Kistimonas asteriae]|uniref:hypothetical protein n=1 Tax=Kistimonas asteriae TaxID=517724 RepID=UPI001BAB924F|nr:hypothetical protein [Kistimonas asteriae]